MIKKLLALIMLLVMAFTVAVPAEAKPDPPNVHKHYNKHNVPNATPGTGDWGYVLFNTGGNIIGLKGRVSVFKTSFTLSAQSPDRDQIYYAPAIMPPNYSCLELDVAHYRFSGGSTTQHIIGFWDWCAGDGTGGWQNTYDLNNTSFWNAYTYQGYTNGERFIDFLVTKANGCSYGYFVNRTTYNYDLKSTACGTNQYGDVDGWTMFETYGALESPNPVCFGGLGPQNSLRAEFHQYNANGTWRDINTLDIEDSIRPASPGPCWNTKVNNHWYEWININTVSWQVIWH